MTQDEPIHHDDHDTSLPSSAVNLTTRRNTFPLDVSAQEARKLKQAQRQQAAPPKRPVNPRHLDEFAVRHERQPCPADHITHHHHPEQPQEQGEKPNNTTISPQEPTSSEPPKKSPTKRLKQPLSIRPKSLTSFLTDGLRLYISNLKNPEQIPGTDWFSRLYAMGLLPVLVVSMAIVQAGIGLLVALVNYTEVGKKVYGRFFDDEIALFDDSDYIDPEGTDEAIRQLASRTPHPKTHFSYHIANLLLIMSSMAYQRDEKLVAEASKLILNLTTDKERDHAAQLLQDSEKDIDDRSTREFGMRFMGISELKTLGGPFAGLFYDDDSIVLVFKGTSVLAFNEYLIDVTIQRVDASEYLYGEVHKGFYECLFPDAKPEMYDNQTYDRTNPFNTIMETIFEVAKAAKEKTGKPVNLWLTGHSLGGALAALVMARLQMPVQEDDPLLRKAEEEDEEDEYDERGHRMHKSRMTSTDADGAPGTEGDDVQKTTVLAKMLAKYSDDPELIVLRDCYSVASPKIGDSIFANEFAKHQLDFCQASPYKSVYWRVVANEDIVPRLPPAGSVDPNSDRKFPPPCVHCFNTPQEWLKEEQDEDQQQGVHPGSHTVKEKPPKHLHSLLDYQHVGQLVRVFNAKRVPVVRPSAFEADLSQGVLRTKEEMLELLRKLGKVAGVWRAQSEQARIEYERKHPKGASAPSAQNQHQDQQQEGKKKDVTKASQTNTPTDLDAEAADVLERAKAAQQITDDVAKAQELYDIDELSRLRQPGRLESLLLMIPSLLSHAPATYQRDLAMVVSA
ncbi:alpha/beta-hydrolase [Linnemannia elongata AG-77]|uniref:Alpha/beta-hydrolase n=1 Tax=Linnemannia elongata AG-77 TaxID=1314771 RepID=A0A197JMQ8_9FUNG|nr:alpha/beta-hydrolase [Linnemannia elongata AG-77]